MNLPGLCFCVAFALHRDWTTRTLFHYFSINTDRLFTCRRVIIMGAVHEPPLRYAVNLNLLIINVSYFTIAFTAASPSTLTTTIPAGAAIVASEVETTVLAIC